MLYVYLFAAIVGGALLAASVVGGDHGGHGALHGDTGHSGASLFSLRLWTYFLAFGGITGLLLHYLTGAGSVLAGLLSAGVAVTASVTARTVIQRALTSGAGGTVQNEELVGKPAEVLLPAARGATGTIRLRVKNSVIDLLAVCEEGELAAKDEVIVVEVKEGRALVTRNPSIKQLGPRT